MTSSTRTHCAKTFVCQCPLLDKIGKRWLTGLTGFFLLASTLSSANADFEEGIFAYQRNNYERAIREWKHNASENNPHALFNLGQMYRRGLGVKSDIRVAKKYYHRSADLGHPGAQGNLGSIYYFHSPSDIEQALYYWRAGSRGGDHLSQYLLGLQYFAGEHAMRNVPLGYAWVKLAAESGLEDAEKTLSQMISQLDDDDLRRGDKLSLTLAELVAKKDKVAPSSTTVLAPDISNNQFRIQIASLRSREAAQEYWRQESSLRKELLEGISHYVIIANLGERGTYFRLQVGSYSEREHAIAFCEQLRKSDLPCFVVPST